jgi:hypothetical protein
VNRSVLDEHHRFEEACFARTGRVTTLRRMNDSERAVARTRRSTEKASGGDVTALVLLANVVMVGLGGLYVTTQSIIVTAIAALLVALLAVLSSGNEMRRR